LTAPAAGPAWPGVRMLVPVLLLLLTAPYLLLVAPRGVLVLA
jgi:hypothetical protein